MNPFEVVEDEVHEEVDEGDDKRSKPCTGWSHRTVIVIVIYVSLLLDNVLLTVIVPILPDFLLSTSRSSSNATVMPTDVLYKKYDFEFVSNILLGTTQSNATVQSSSNSSPIATTTAEDENVSIGVLLSTKAFVQLAFNPIIGWATKRIGYHWPILLGTLSLVMSSMLFAIGDNYGSLLFARAVQGVGSSCLGVCGMSLVATLYPEDDKRSKVMGVVLGSIALGVLIGYPVGGILYDFVGKSSPFWIISALLVIVVVVQVRWLSLSWTDLVNCRRGGMDTPESAAGEQQHQQPKWWDLLADFEINLISLAIFISTSAMAILEPCLPLWLLANLHPQKWQLGTVFIPDSLGYLIGTNGFGKLAFDLGQTRVAVAALIVIGCSCIIIPGSKSMASLLIPHFGLGLGIGVLDASLVPYLSSRIDTKYSSTCYSDCSVGSDSFSSNYGTVYAIQQMAVSLAYSASPLLASEVVKFMGFPLLMFCIGVLNVLYAVTFYYFVAGPCAKLNQFRKNSGHLLATTSGKMEGGGGGSGNYNRFYNSTN